MNWIKNCLLVFFSISISLMFLELGLRITKHDFRFVDFRSAKPDIEDLASPENGQPFKYDSQLGWTPNPGFSSERIHILANGTRSNGRGTTAAAAETGQKTILIVGDSFVFGDEVTDEQTWPAYLQKRTAHTVINGGVNGYGLDQVFLRSKALIDEFSPQLLIFTIFPDDIYRCTLSERGKPKPYFILQNGQLALKNTPVPKEAGSRRKKLRLIDLMSKSLLFHEVMMRVNGEWWLRTAEHLFQETTGSDHELIAKNILAEAVRYYASRGIKTYFLIQYNDLHIDTIRMINRVTEGIVKNDNFKLIDTRFELFTIRNADFEEFKSLFFTTEVDGKFFASHMTPKGNELIANLVYKNISADNLLTKSF